MKYHLREYHSLFPQSIIGKKKLKLKDVITSSICTIVDRTCYIFFYHVTSRIAVEEAGIRHFVILNHDTTIITLSIAYRTDFQN
jgi:hypothetical protein